MTAFNAWSPSLHQQPRHMNSKDRRQPRSFCVAPAALAMASLLRSREPEARELFDGRIVRPHERNQLLNHTPLNGRVFNRA